MLAAIALGGCGRKGDPLPPQIRRPDATRDLSVAQIGTDAILTWSYPSMTSAGGPLPDLEKIEVWRAVLPQAQEPPPSPGSRDRQVRLGLLQGQGEMLLELGLESLEAATRGPALVIVDDLEAWRTVSEVPVDEAVLWYAVRSVCCRGRESDFSNIVRLVPQPPPDPPPGLTATPGPDGIRVSWQQPEGLAVAVERAADGSAWSQITARPVAGSEFLDVSAEQGRRWRYRLRSVRLGTAETDVVGPPGSEIEVDHPDRYPPEPPTELVCLPEGRRVRLKWVTAVDAAGHRVTRSVEAGSSRVLAAMLPGSSLDDDEPPTGSLTYAVESVDAAGNRSEPVTCSAVVGPVP